MPVFEYLPTEILRQILACLDRPELRVMSCLSWFFHSIAEPFLYASLGGYQGWLIPTLRALVARPALARHVRRGCFNGWIRVIAHDSVDGERFSATARQLGLEIPWSAESQPWTNADQPWTNGTLALLLLHMIPNTQVLDITHWSLLAKFIENTLTMPIESLPLKSLRIFEFDEYTQESRVTPRMLLALMRFPSLRELTVDLQSPENYVHDIAGTMASIIAFAGQSPITHLSLHYGNTGTTMLRHILQMPRALTHFSYADDDMYEYQPDTTLFRAAFLVLRPTLQSLSINSVRALQLGKPGEQNIGSLSDWPLLTKIDCSMTGLVGTRVAAKARLVDRLPMGIRELKLRRTDELSDLPPACEWTMSEMTDQLFDVVLERPELVLLTVHTAYSITRVRGVVNVEKRWIDVYHAEVRERLAVACEARGVSVVVTWRKLVC